VPHPLPIGVRSKILPAVLRGAALSDLPGPDALSRIDCEVLILAWTADPGHPVEVAESLARAIPRARLEIAATPTDLAGWPTTAASFLRD
jgi:pimeloyl-ACP methyl ester carboxylesterase